MLDSPLDNLSGIPSPFGGRRLWLPTRLFLNGEEGAWYDPSDLTTLYQDSAGTTPVTADGDPVGRMEDKSGNGNHATQSTSAARPVYKTDGTLHWLEFDGVDDFMDFSMSVPDANFTAIAGLSFEDLTAGLTGLEVSAPTRSDSQFYYALSNGKLQQTFRNTDFSSSGGLVTGTVVAEGGAFVASSLANGSDLIHRVNGAQESSTDAATWPDSALLNGSIGANTNGAQNLEIKFFGSTLIAAPLADTDLTRAERYVAKKSGVVL